MFDTMHLYNTKILIIGENIFSQSLIEKLQTMTKELKIVQYCNENSDEHRVFQPDIVIYDQDIETTQNLEKIMYVKKTCSFSRFILITRAAKKEYYEQLLQMRSLTLLVKPVDQAIILEVLAQAAKTEKLTSSLSLESQFSNLSEMLRNIVHQWRQPLNRLSGVFINIGVANDFDEITKEFLEEKLDQGEQTLKYLSDTIEDVRNMYSNTQVKKSFDIQSLVTEVMQMTSTSSEKKYINMRLNTSSECVLYGYKKQLFQALMNIIQNAKDQFSIMNIPNPEIKISIQKNQTACIVTIIDNGGGVSFEPVEEIFHPYKTTKKHQGTGLGLYISKVIIETKMDGQVYAENVENGLKMVIELPFES